MDEKAIQKYCRQVGKHLKCFRKIKAALLAGLREELLISEDGKLPSPKETAVALQEYVSEKETINCRKRARLCSTLIYITVLVSIFIFVFCFLWDTLPIYQVTNHR